VGGNVRGRGHEARVVTVSRSVEWSGAARFSQTDATILYNMTQCMPKVGFSGPGIGYRLKSLLQIRSRRGREMRPVSVFVGGIQKELILTD
jgi:hypothetical protein